MKEYKNFEDLHAAWNDVCEEAERCLSPEDAREKISKFFLGLSSEKELRIADKSCDCEPHYQDE